MMTLDPLMTAPSLLSAGVAASTAVEPICGNTTGQVGDLAVETAAH